MDAELKRVQEYITNKLKKGYQLDSIKTSLIAAGFSKSVVNQAIKGKSKIKKTGFFGWLWGGEKKKIVVKPKPKPKPKPIPKKVEKPKKKTPGFFARLFVKKKTVKKVVPKPVVPVKPIKKPPKKPEKPKKKTPGFFARLFSRKKKKITVKPKAKKKSKPKKEKKSKRKKPFIRGYTAVILLLLFFIGVGAIIWWFPASCATESCFVRRANNCEHATFSNIIEGTTLRYEVNNCILKKTVVKLADDEPLEIVAKFKGKTMLCMYAPNDFSPLYINTLSGMLNTCEGELKQAILDYVK